jgi:hypothetical protein
LVEGEGASLSCTRMATPPWPEAAGKGDQEDDEGRDQGERDALQGERPRAVW